MMVGFSTLASPFPPLFTIVDWADTGIILRLEDTMTQCYLVSEGVGMAVPDGDSSHDHHALPAHQLQDVGQGKVGDVDVIWVGVETVEEAIQCFGHISVSEDDPLGSAGTARCVHDDGRGLYTNTEPGINYNTFCGQLLPGVGGTGSADTSARLLLAVFLPRLMTSQNEISLTSSRKPVTLVLGYTFNKYRYFAFKI